MDKIEKIQEFIKSKRDSQKQTGSLGGTSSVMLGYIECLLPAYNKVIQQRDDAESFIKRIDKQLKETIDSLIKHFINVETKVKR